MSADIRGMKILVYAMGITLIGGVIIVIALIGSKLSETPLYAQVHSCADGPVALPEGVSIEAMDVEGGNVRLLVRRDGKGEVLSIPCAKP